MTAKRKRPGPGRPPAANPRATIVAIRVSADEHASIAAAAARARRSLSEWIRLAALDAAATTAA